MSPWLTGLCLLVILTCGCTPVDRWRAFDVDVEKSQHVEPEAQVKTEPNEISKESPAIVVEDGKVELTVEQAVFSAITHNREIAVSRHQPVITGAFEMIERGRFDPELFGEASFSRERGTEVARSTGTSFSVTADEGNVSAGVRQELPTGTGYELGVSQRRTISSRSPELQQARVGLTVTQQLLRGFGPAVNLASVRQARLDTLASQYELRGVTQALVAEAEIAYWEYALALRRNEIFEESLKVARSQLDEVRQRIEVGVLPEAESAAAESEVALRKQDLIDAMSDAQAKRLKLLRILNPAGRDDLDIQVVIQTPLVSDQSDPPTESLDDRTALALRSRPDLNESRLRLEQDRLETVVTRNGLLPRLELFAELGKSGYGSTFSGSFRDMDSNDYDALVGVRLSQYLGNRAAKGRDLAARTTRAQSAAAVANLEQLVRYELRVALNELDRAKQQVAASAQTRRLQELTSQAERERFDVGTRTALDVALAQRDLIASRVREAEAAVAYRVALVNLYLAEGTLLERRGITVGPGR